MWGVSDAGPGEPFGGDAAEASARLRAVHSAVRRPLERALDGNLLNDDDALVLIGAEDPNELSALCAVAGHVRTRLKGTTVTYSPKVFLPVTNLCRDRCSYCTFRSDPDDAHAWTMLPEEIRACCRTGRSQGCVEALMCRSEEH